MSILQWLNNQWQIPAGTYTRGRHIAVAPDGTAYMTDSGGGIYKWSGPTQGFQGFSGGCANHSGDTPGLPVLGAGPNDWLWVIGCSSGSGGNDIEYYSPISNSWTQIPGIYATTISVSSDGTPWIIDSSQRIYEYVSQWQLVGPSGFSFNVGQTPYTWSGWVHDVDTGANDGTVSFATRGAGIWQYLTCPTCAALYHESWQGAGVGLNGVQSVSPPGPANNTSTVAVKPNNSNWVIAGTGIGSNGPSPQPPQQGAVWWTSCAQCGGGQTGAVPWVPSIFYNGAIQELPPTAVVKIRYSRNGEMVYLITSLSANVS
jgi:hypothetical protein